jgi:membrane protein DedA with SNARE-associated domain
MSELISFITEILNLPVNHPLAFIPLFILEEFGLPLPLVLSGLFTYVGFLASQGQESAMILVGFNLVGAVAGSTVIYWCSRCGLSLPLWRLGSRLTLGQTSFTEMMARLGSTNSFIVLWFRLSPLPLVITSVCCGLLRVRYRIFTLGVAISAITWNLIYLIGGFIAGWTSQQVWGELSGFQRYTPVAVVWIGGAIIFAILRWRKRWNMKRNKVPSPNKEVNIQ